MEEAYLKGKKYTFIRNFKDNELYRKSYNTLTRKTYGFDFEQWYKQGYWGDNYMPYSLLDGENIVANVSASIIDFLVLGETKKYLQIGTVMTDSAYRNNGMARYLMDKVIEEWINKCDMIYLFANDSVLDFYPKFGFTSVSEYQYSKAIKTNNNLIHAEKMDMSLEKSKQLVLRKVLDSISISKLAMLDNAGLIMFYCASFMSSNVYYLKDQDVIVIAEVEGDTLYLQDVFSSSEFDLDTIISSLADKKIKKVVLGFTPNSTNGYNLNLLQEYSTTLFVMKSKEHLFLNNKLMFPVLSHT